MRSCKTQTKNDSLLRSVTGKIGAALCLWFGLFYALNILTAIIISVLMYTELDEKVLLIVEEILAMISYAVGFAVPIAVLHKRMSANDTCELYEAPKPSRALPKKSALIVISAIAINFAAAYLNSYLVSFAFPNADYSLLESSSSGEVYEVVFMFISIAVIPAIVEELLFRRVILTSLLPFGRGCAIAVSAVAFGLMHGNPLQLFYATLMGVVIGYVYVRTGSILCCMLIHFCNNLLSVAQESVNLLVQSDVAIRVNGAIEIAVLILGSVSLVILIAAELRRPRPEDGGSFGKIFEPSLEYARVPTTSQNRLRNIFSPSMTVFVVLSAVSAAITLFAFNITF